MHFRTIASIALWACAANAAVELQPYKLTKATVLGVSLSRRASPGYQPEQSVCGDGSTCAEACGKGYETCPSNDDSTHCFNPTVKQTCCSDGSGNSCDHGYYCTHDTKSQTWCCPDSMDLVQCAASYGLKDALESDAAYTSTTAAPTTSTTTSELKTTSTTVYVTSTSTSAPETTSTQISTTHVTPTSKTVPVKTTTICPSSGYSTAWRGTNSTIASAVPTQPSESSPAPIDTTAPVEPPLATAGAATTGMSALLLVAAGVFALL
ncbi:hypothetical protein FZEAL_5901 [Fusarium zealandicum]|uniref:Prp 4 CRoW domain-containing protein n=1 Tax=Fusarium zealandicum TaxID=1053134 RepID=A0A8H4UJW4_9HYPO|nr:hypothetical protein FZEAL_5901 [Fusarium zealandicum]